MNFSLLSLLKCLSVILVLSSSGAAAERPHIQGNRMKFEPRGSHLDG